MSRIICLNVIELELRCNLRGENAWIKLLTSISRNGCFFIGSGTRLIDAGSCAEQNVGTRNFSGMRPRASGRRPDSGLGRQAGGECNFELRTVMLTSSWVPPLYYRNCEPLCRYVNLWVKSISYIWFLTSICDLDVPWVLLHQTTWGDDWYLAFSSGCAMQPERLGTCTA